MELILSIISIKKKKKNLCKNPLKMPNMWILLYASWIIWITEQLSNMGLLWKITNCCCNFLIHRRAPFLSLKCLFSEKPSVQFSLFISELKTKLCDKCEQQLLSLDGQQ